MRTQVGIIGAGPAGLVLAHLLHSYGIECVVLEMKSREYIERRIRAGVLEQGSVEILEELDIASRMHREGLIHRGIELGFNRRRHRIDFPSTTGRSVTIYGQHEVIKDLLAAADAREIRVHFDVPDVAIRSLDSSAPFITFSLSGSQQTLNCDYIAGCDGFRGISRTTIAADALETYERVYPFSWLGVLAEAQPSHDELIYMNSEHGFALFSMRSPLITRLYLQCDAEEDLSRWSDDRIWHELLLRFQCDDGWRPRQGRILQKSITPMRSFVTEPMQYGRLYLAGDAAHIVPPTGAKGMNLAIADVKVLAEALRRHYQSCDDGLLARYPQICLRRVWRAQRFSWWMTSMLHKDASASRFDQKRQLAELEYVISSASATASLAENYVGLPIEID
jgi:p-hydroxybenzoate 3-monooxygenase